MCKAGEIFHKVGSFVNVRVKNHRALSSTLKSSHILWLNFFSFFSKTSYKYIYTHIYNIHTHTVVYIYKT